MTAQIYYIIYIPDSSESIIEITGSNPGVDYCIQYKEPF